MQHAGAWWAVYYCIGVSLYAIFGHSVNCVATCCWQLHIGRLDERLMIKPDDMIQ